MLDSVYNLPDIRTLVLERWRALPENNVTGKGMVHQQAAQKVAQECSHTQLHAQTLNAGVY